MDQEFNTFFQQYLIPVSSPMTKKQIMLARVLFNIYLQSIDTGQPVHVWKLITPSYGEFEIRFIPDWRNLTLDSSFHLLITGWDLPAWAGHGPVPTFHVHFDGNIPSSVNIRPMGASSQVGGISVEIINGISYHSHVRELEKQAGGGLVRQPEDVSGW
ncbi:hypothetical protein BY996DRAFT_6420567 [Phakopsora pachyrhizi]|nr:hypothetical protein BY996DRAFT_6420567 [Phakopsora pachyrhizi]